jgi:hypothetical protein
LINPFAALEALIRWLSWNEETRGSSKPTKVPYSATASGGPRQGFGSSTDPATWGVRTQAETRARELANGSTTMTGIGIVLGEIDKVRSLLGIDLDSCLDDNRQLAPWAAAILQTVPSYAEISPSGRGIKVFFYALTARVRAFLDAVGVEPDASGTKRGVPGLPGADHGAGIEIYAADRYFTVTGQCWDLQHQDIVQVDGATLDRLVPLIPKSDNVERTKRNTGNGTAKPSNGGDASRSAWAASIAVALVPDNYREMCDGLRNHPEPDIRAWVSDKGEASNERELKRIWQRIVARRTSARLLGMGDLDQRSGSNGPDPGEPEPTQKAGGDAGEGGEGGGGALPPPRGDAGAGAGGEGGGGALPPPRDGEDDEPTPPEPEPLPDLNDITHFETFFPLPQAIARQLKYDSYRGIVWVHALTLKSTKDADGNEVVQHVWTPVCTPFSLRAWLRLVDADSTYGLRLLVADRLGLPQTLDCERAELARQRAAEIKGRLLAAGMRFAPGQENLVIDVLKQASPADCLDTVAVTGWQSVTFITLEGDEL